MATVSFWFVFSCQMGVDLTWVGRAPVLVFLWSGGALMFLRVELPPSFHRLGLGYIRQTCSLGGAPKVVQSSRGGPRPLFWVRPRYAHSRPVVLFTNLTGGNVKRTPG